jgi:hypothetical protein
MNVIIGASKPKRFSFISRGIRLVENTPFSHVYVKLYDKDTDRWCIYEASHSSLHYISLERFNKKNKTLEAYEIPATEEKEMAVKNFCLDCAETSYGRLEIVGMLFIRLAKFWFNLNLRNPFSDGLRTQVCSEVGGHVMALLGLNVDEKVLEEKGPKYIINKLREACAEGKASRVTL